MVLTCLHSLVQHPSTAIERFLLWCDFSPTMVLASSTHPSPTAVLNFLTPLTRLRLFFLIFFFVKVPYEDLLDASELLIRALTLRRDYCRPASHSFPSTTARFVTTNEQNGIADVETIHEEKKTVEGKIETRYALVLNIMRVFVVDTLLNLKDFAKNSKSLIRFSSSVMCFPNAW